MEKEHHWSTLPGFSLRLRSECQRRSKTAKQQPAFEAVVLAKSDRQPCPLMEPRAFGAFAGGQSRPGVRIEVFRQAGGIGLNETAVFKKSQRMVRACGQDISLTAIFEHTPDLGISAVKCIGQHPSAGQAAI